MSRFLLFWLCPHPEGHCGPESRQVSPGQQGVARTSPGVGDKLPRESLLEALGCLPFSMVQAARTPLRSKCGRGLMGGTPLLSFTSEVWTITGWIEAPLEKNVLPVSEERTRDSQVCSSPEATSAHPFPWWPNPGENPAAQC